MCVRLTSAMEADKEEERILVRCLTAEEVGGRKIHCLLFTANAACYVRMYWKGTRDYARDVYHCNTILNILPTAQISPHAIFTFFLRVEERHSWTSFCIGRRRV